MRSQAATDLRHGLIACIVLVAIALWVVNVINRHAEEHGHCPPLAMLDVELAQRDQGDAAQGQGGDGGHGCFIARGSLSTPLNKVERP